MNRVRKPAISIKESETPQKPTESNRRHHTERPDLDHHTPQCQHHPTDADPPPNRSHHTGGTVAPSSWRTTTNATRGA
jgi:hypothetical protein